MQRFSRFLRTALILLPLFALGCSPYRPTPVGDGGLSSGRPCGAPCFHNILPGTTTEKEFGLLKQDDKIFSSCRKYDFSSSGGTLGYQCAFGNVGIRESKVIGITFWPSAAVKVQEALEKYGEPRSAAIIRQNLLPEDVRKLAMQLYYDRPCMVFSLEDEYSEKYVVTGDSLITQADYMAPSLCPSPTSAFSVRWKGFGTYVP